MKALLSAALIITCVLGNAVATLPRATPESQGVSPGALLDFIEATDQIDAMHSFMLVRHGRVIAEGWWTPYDAASNHELYSLSKSFTSTAVGIAVAEGRLSIDDEVLKFFSEDAPAEPSTNLKSMRIRDLLTMSTGHQDETSSAPDKISAKSFLAHPVPHKPGTHFRYNTPATFMLSAIVQKQTGQTVLDYLRPRLFEPLGIANPVWSTNWQGVSLGGYGMRATTEDIARFGHLYLQRGRWHGRQLLDPKWVDLAASRQVSNGSNPKSDWEQGYGFQFWRCRNGAYRGDGAFGQFCIVLPEQDAVIAITSGVKDMQGVMNLIWDKLLPGFHPKRLRADTETRKKLEARLASLKIRTAQGNNSSPRAPDIFNKTFSFDTNDQKIEAITLRHEADGKGLTLTLRADGIESRFPCGFGDWKKGRGNFAAYRNEPAAGSAAWTSEDTCVVKLCLTETPYHATLKMKFDGDQVQFDSETNVGFGPTKRPQLIGRLR